MRRWIPSQTIVEMLVVLAVFALLSAMLVTFSRTGDVQGKVSRQMDLLVTDIRRTQETAYFSRLYQGLVPCGYALSFATSSYAIQVVTSTDCAQTGLYTFANATAITDYKRVLTAPIALSSVSSNPIVFVRPAPRAVFYPDSDRATIVLSAAGVSRTLTINKFGGMEVR